MQSIQIWKICSLVCMTNSILFTSCSIVLCHNYLNKWKKYFEKIFSQSLCLGFTSLNILLSACFLKHPCKQCSTHLDINSISLEICYIFSRFNVIVSNPATFLATFNFTLIIRHNIMVYDLELHAIAITCCFRVRQPHVQWFL